MSSTALARTAQRFRQALLCVPQRLSGRFDMPISSIKHLFTDFLESPTESSQYLDWKEEG